MSVFDTMYRDHPVPYHIAKNDYPSGFIGYWTHFSTWLEQLNISDSEADSWLLIDYYEAPMILTPYFAFEIFKKVAAENKKKYDHLLAVYAASYNPTTNYSRSEDITEIRTPNIEKTSTGSGSSSTGVQGLNTMQRNQTRTTTENGGDYSAVDTRAVRPFDASAFNDAERHTQSASGSRTTSDAYTGQPDQETRSSQTTATASDSRTDTETGTDTKTKEATISGVNGNMAEILSLEIDFSDRLNIWHIIEKDIAKELFLQIW